MGTATARYSAVDRRRQIMDVARELFARRGFQGTTTRQIAEEACVNEAIIFRHFASKEELYWAVIEQQCEYSRHEPLADQRRRYPSDRDFLAALAQEILERRARSGTLSRLLLYSALENHRLSHRFFRTYIAHNFEMLADYIRQGIRAGKFRNVDPLLAARGFLGMIVYHSWMQELFGYKRYQKFDTAQVSRTLSDIWLQGMRAEQKSETTVPVSKSKNGARIRKNHGA